MSVAPSKAALLERIDRERAIWEQFVAEIGQNRMLEPGATGDWTFKDVVAHLMGWRVWTLAKLDAARRGQAPPPMPWPAQLSEDTDTDAINDWIYTTNRDRPLRDVLNEYGQSFQRMRDAVLALPDRDLADPNRYAWMAGEPLGMVIEYSFGHLHEEHEPALREWLDRGTSAE